MKRRRETHNRSHKEGGYVLKGILYCGNCGKPLYGNPNRSHRRTGKVKYVCKTAIKYGRQCSCGQWSVTEEEVLPFVVQRLVKGLEKRAINEANMTPSGRQSSPAADCELAAQICRNREEIGRERNGF